MSETQIKEWQKTIKSFDDSIDVDGDFGTNTLKVSIKVAEKAGIIKPEPPKPPVVGKFKGSDFIKLANTRIGEEYVYGADVDLNNPNWHGPWDCAEFCTWVVKQITGRIYGCVDNNAANPEPYTGGWKNEVINGNVTSIPISKAAKTKGAILLRYRTNGKHIVFSNGDGTTVEAKGTDYGVCKSTIGNLSSWDFGILVPNVNY
jgi:N-acetylmuramoyl-L-alanine amidase